MNRLSNVTDNGRGGLFATTLQEEVVRRELAAPDRVFLSLDGSKIHIATQFLMALGEQLRVPDLAEAEDWDYLDECLVDLDEFPVAESFTIFLTNSSIWRWLTHVNGRRSYGPSVTPSRKVKSVGNRCTYSCAETRLPRAFRSSTTRKSLDLLHQASLDCH